MRTTTRALWLVLLAACSGEQSDELGEGDAGPSGELDGGGDGATELDAASADDGGSPDGGSDAGGGGDAGVPDGNVTGKILGLGGAPLAGVTLHLGGQTVQTDAEGQFTATVTTPYDLVVEQPTDTYVFLDVERLDPTLHLPSGASARSAQVSGRVDGGELVSFPLDTTTYVNVTFAGGPGFFSERLNPGDGAAYGPFPVTWDVGDSVDGYLVAVASNYMGNGFSDPIAVAVSPLSVMDGVDVTGTPETLLELVAPATRTVQVDIELPAGYDVSYCSKSLGTYSRALQDPGAAFALTVVDGLPADLAQNFYCELRDTDGRLTQAFTTVPAGATLPMDPPAGIRALEPADETGLAQDVTFTFTPQAGAVSFVTLTWTEFGSDGETRTDYRVQVATDGTSVAGARLAALGVDVSPATEWTASAQGPWPDLDAYLGPDVTPAGVRVQSADLPRTFSSLPP